ncbi:hypothetical protein RD792_007946 [Penstemon davidsonii]|uniref:Pentatricopeptide repeat-containing protein n=1 Tax=Penstemon davidsonii TaxID=160366 RepID=A0ABR0D7R9_9LAMI|nr:hypothetical protein RD792_007946 [Penstemon davidsonii]
MYSKCGLCDLASIIFHELTRRDIIYWSTIEGYAQRGAGEEAFELLSWMRREGPKPTKFALSSVLSVCGSIAILDRGRQTLLLSSAFLVLVAVDLRRVGKPIRANPTRPIFELEKRRE